MTRRAYKTDVTDAQWEILEPLIPPAKPGGHPRTVDMREVVNGLFYVLRTGCGWEILPHDLPPYESGVLLLSSLAENRCLAADEQYIKSSSGGGDRRFLPTPLGLIIIINNEGAGDHKLLRVRV